jgi:hypothetical protein
MQSQNEEKEKLEINNEHPTQVNSQQDQSDRSWQVLSSDQSNANPIG